MSSPTANQIEFKLVALKRTEVWHLLDKQLVVVILVRGEPYFRALQRPHLVCNRNG